MGKKADKDGEARKEKFEAKYEEMWGGENEGATSVW